MPTQAARVALWIPTTTPGAIGQAVAATATPAGAQVPIPSAFANATIPYATAGEMQSATVTGKAIDPAILRGELVRLLTVPTADMTAGDIVTRDVTEPNRLVLTDVNGRVSQQLIPAVPAVMPDVIDAGTF